MPGDGLLSGSYRNGIQETLADKILLGRWPLEDPSGGFIELMTIDDDSLLNAAV